MSIKIRNIFLIIFFFSSIFFIYLKFFETKKTTEISFEIPESNKIDKNIIERSNSNIINDVRYNSKDSKGNEYEILASEGEIDYSDSNIIYLTNVKALINLKNSESIIISSDFGKYNNANFDTIFSKNVVIKYLENQITSEYVDFSIKRNSMEISKNVIYISEKNMMKADVIEMNLETKDTKIFMYEESKKVNIKSKN